MSHEPHIESIWNQARGLKDGTPNPDASVSEGQPSALRASAPEGQDALLPCPFCGDTPKLSGVTQHIVCCENRGCIHPGTGWWRSLEGAIAAWNRRAPPQADAKANLARAAPSPTPEGISELAPEGVDPKQFAEFMRACRAFGASIGQHLKIRIDDELRRAAAPPTTEGIDERALWEVIGTPMRPCRWKLRQVGCREDNSPSNYFQWWAEAQDEADRRNATIPPQADAVANLARASHSLAPEGINALAARVEGRQ